MKTSHMAALAAHVVAYALFPQISHATDPAVPVGTLDAFPTIVQTGTHPTLTWDIQYPSLVEDVINITPPGTIQATQTLFMDVRIVGTGVTRAFFDSRGRLTSTESVTAQARMRINSGSWSTIFQGNLYQVNPNQVVHTRQVVNGTVINFGGRYLNSDGSWSTTYTSQSSTTNVIALVDGDLVPNRVPDYGAPTLESFLRPYMTSDNRVNIGPMDVIYVMELTHTNQNDSGFDLQDMVVLVTFRRVTN